MADYGFRISKAGVDVKTGDDKDMVLTSKYPLLKGVLQGSGSVVVTSGTINVLEVSHNLGYRPFAQAFVKLPSPEVTLLPTDRYLEFTIPRVVTGIERDSYFLYSDANKLYISFNWADFTGTYSTMTAYYQYFIYLDKGKL